MSIDTLLTENRVIKSSPLFKENAHPNIASFYTQSKENRLQFWEERADELSWFQNWESVLDWQRPYAKWFCGGKLNASYNCLDVHLKTNGTKTAIIWEGENGDTQHISYNELHQKVCQLANQLRHELGIEKGDRVTLYMPMIPELAIAVLACARIGAIHSVVFAGFSAQSLRDRIDDSSSKLLITTDGGYRRGKVIPLQDIAYEALEESCESIESVLLLRYINPDKTATSPAKGTLYDYKTLIQNASIQCEATAMDSEDTLFILYTSGTTGKPKGIVHTTGGYMTHAKYSTRAVFDLKDTDIYWCTADIGWITGHTYLIYGPLANGATTLMFEGTPDYPEQNRFWDIIERHKVSIFYTAPTAIRSFMKWGLEPIEKHDLSSLRLLGTVGEPINPEVWLWYHKHIGGENCPIVDTWWQTETGGIMISNLPAHNDMKPGSAGLPLPGISAEVLNQDGSTSKTGGGLLSLTEPWPSMLRGIWGDPKRFEETYWATLPTYFAGDGATIDDDGYFMVLGRIDDVLNVAGHRIGTMEVESAVVEHPSVAEAAVVGMPDEIKGQSILAFVILKEGVDENDTLRHDVIQTVVSSIGAIARPKQIIFTPELPKTRSGKIMRRILKNLAAGEAPGDSTTLANPDIVTFLEEQLNH